MHGPHALWGALSGHLVPSVHWVFFRRRDFLPVFMCMVHVFYLGYLVSWRTHRSPFLGRRGFLPTSTRMVYVLYLGYLVSLGCALSGRIWVLEFIMVELRGLRRLRFLVACRDHDNLGSCTLLSCLGLLDFVVAFQPPFYSTGWFA